jgi:hypothetical protein
MPSANVAWHAQTVYPQLLIVKNSRMFKFLGNDQNPSITPRVIEFDPMSVKRPKSETIQ